MKDIYIIDPESPGEHERSCTAIGPFGSVPEAEAYLVRDGAETFAESDTPLNHTLERRDWAAPVQIVRVLKTVQQLPVVNVTCKLITPAKEPRG